MAIPGGFIDELVARSDIHSIVSTYVQLKKSGSGYVGLCPFHNEKTPSFHVDGDKQLFYCFGCGTGGGVISFVMKIEHLEFVEAVEYLAKRAGMEVPADREDAVLRQSRKRYIEMHRLAARFYYSMLLTPKGKLALEYFIRRGFDVKTIKQFGLGFAPDSWSELTAELKSKGFSEDELVEAGLSIKNPKGNVYDRFRNRVMFPIIDVKGDVIAFGGRVMDNSVPK
ncbi:MAG: DNA primase, partial [Clostridiales bacterium]|nr:DNA primase [Clostridiales bacterium]